MHFRSAVALSRLLIRTGLTVGVYQCQITNAKVMTLPKEVSSRKIDLSQLRLAGRDLSGLDLVCRYQYYIEFYCYDTGLQGIKGP